MDCSKDMSHRRGVRAGHHTCDNWAPHREVNHSLHRSDKVAARVEDDRYAWPQIDDLPTVGATQSERPATLSRAVAARSIGTTSASFQRFNSCCR